MSIFQSIPVLRRTNFDSLNVRQIQQFINQFESSFKKETRELKMIMNTTQQELLSIMTEALWFVHQKEESEKTNQEFFGGLIRVLMARLQKTPKDHALFNSELMQTLPRWNQVLRVVVLQRMNELQSTKVLFRKGKYDLSGVRQTHYGKIVMEAIGLKSRYILTKSEYREFQIKTQGMGFELPKEIMPTEAEKYFRDLDEEED